MALPDCARRSFVRLTISAARTNVALFIHRAVRPSAIPSPPALSLILAGRFFTQQSTGHES